MLLKRAELAQALTGSLSQQRSAVSYDFLYSLQFEFCFWARIHKILIGDFIKVQNTPSNDAGTFSTTVKAKLVAT
jgi:hypothetical protein